MVMDMSLVDFCWVVDRFSAIFSLGVGKWYFG